MEVSESTEKVTESSTKTEVTESTQTVTEPSTKTEVEPSTKIGSSESREAVKEHKMEIDSENKQEGEWVYSGFGKDVLFRIPDEEEFDLPQVCALSVSSV